MAKTTKYTCDHEATEHDLAEFVIYTELKNGSTLFSLNERHSCNDPSHLGELVMDTGNLVSLIQEATKEDPKGRYSPENWMIVGCKVHSLQMKGTNGGPRRKVVELRRGDYQRS